jgi:hypothetical protein
LDGKMRSHSIAWLVLILMGCQMEWPHYVEWDAPPPPRTHVLSVQVGSNGSGVVSSDPAGLACSAGACSLALAEGTQVTVSAAATAGSFLGWTGDCRGQGACTVTLDQDRTVGALFGTPGSALWVKQLGDVSRDFGASIAIDGNGDLIAVGGFRGTLMAGSALPSAGGWDLYVVKLAGATGDVLWARRYGGASDDYISAVSVDESNNVYVLGGFQGQADFGSGPLTATPSGLAAPFVLKLAPDGSFGWVRKLDGTLNAIALASKGSDIAVVGDYYGSMTIDATTFMSSGSADVLVVKLAAATGATTWVRSFGGSEWDYPNDVALDGGGNVVLTGQFMGTVNFGGGPLSAPSGTLNGFLLKLASANGSYLISRQFGDMKLSTGRAVAVDPANNIFVTGVFESTLSLGCTNNLTALQTGLDDVFLVKYSQAGACAWAKSFSGPAAMPTTSPPRASYAVAVNAAGDVAIAGSFCGTISFGGQPLTSAGVCPRPNAFAARLAGDGTPRSAVRAGGTSGDAAYGIAQSADGRFFVTGEFSGFAEFGGTALTAKGPTDAFIAAFAPL